MAVAEAGGHLARPGGTRRRGTTSGASRLSSSETSTRPPSPVFSRRSEREQDALERGHAREHVGDARRPRVVGGPSGAPVMLIKPALALRDRVVAGLAAPGPVGSVAGDRGVDEPRVARAAPPRRRTPGGRACPAGSSRPARRPRPPAAAGCARPSSCLRFSVSERLPRLTERKYVLSPSTKGGPQPRVSSPFSGSSILTTSAPASASAMRAVGAGQDAREVDDADAAQGLHARR